MPEILKRVQDDNLLFSFRVIPNLFRNLFPFTLVPSNRSWNEFRMTIRWGFYSRSIPTSSVRVIPNLVRNLFPFTSVLPTDPETSSGWRGWGSSLRLLWSVHSDLLSPRHSEFISESFFSFPRVLPMDPETSSGWRTTGQIFSFVAHTFLWEGKAPRKLSPSMVGENENL